MPIAALPVRPDGTDLDRSAVARSWDTSGELDGRGLVGRLEHEAAAYAEM